MSRKNSSEFHLVSSGSGLNALIKRLAQAGTIAVDTEADSLHHYYEKVCLIQLSFEQENYIVDPLSPVDLESFLDELALHRLLLHGGDYDLRLLRSSHGFRPRKQVFDTMLAAQILGRDKISLADLAFEFFDVTMSKRGRKSDWSARPLSAQQLKYAVDDTLYLGRIAERLAQELEKCGRLGWHAESCAAMVTATENNKERNEDELWRIKGTSRLDRPQLAFVREIWKWREKQAQKVDRPPFKVMGNQLIIDLAVWATETGEENKLRPRLPRNLTGPRLKSFEASFVRVRSLHDSELPELKKHKFITPDWLNTFEKLRAGCSAVAEKLHMAPHLLAPRRALERIASKRVTGVESIMAEGGLLRWQAELIESAVKSVIDSE